MEGDQLYYGLERIAARLKVSRPTARRFVQLKLIRAFKLEATERAPWCCIESMISEDITALPSQSVEVSLL